MPYVHTRQLKGKSSKLQTTAAAVDACPHCYGTRHYLQVAANEEQRAFITSFACAHEFCKTCMLTDVAVFLCFVYLQIAPGKYDERGLIAFDYVLETARKYGLQVIVSFIDNWKYYNGIDQYLDWSTTAPARGPEHQAPFKDQSGDPTPGEQQAM